MAHDTDSTETPRVRDATDHEVIWLQPWCDGCQQNCYSDEGRTWCTDDAYGACGECGRLPVKYVIAPDQPTPITSAD